jgi:hypothetical protein
MTTSNNRIRGPAKTYYHYLLTNNNTHEREYFKTLNQITEKYEISRSNIYLMVKNPSTIRRKYNDISIEKIHLHYLVVEQDIDPALIM